MNYIIYNNSNKSNNNNLKDYLVHNIYKYKKSNKK